MFSMQVQLTASHETLQLGEDCTFTLTATPGSIVLLTGFSATLTTEGLKAKFTTFENSSYSDLKRNKHRSDIFMLRNVQHSSTQCSHQKSDEVESRKPGDSDSIQITDFWFFETSKVEEDGTIEVSKSTPEKVRNWTIVAAVFHPEHGPIFSEILSIKVSANISMQVITPTSTRFREPTKIDVLVFNSMPESEKVQVTMSKGDNYEDFEFLDCEHQSSDGFMKTHELEVAANSVGSVSFYFRPMRPGNLELNLKVEPENAEATETERTLFVEREGLTKYSVTSQLIDLRESGRFSSRSQLPVYSAAISKSVKIEASIETDLIKTAILNARNLM